MAWSWQLEWAEICPGILIGTCPMTLEDLHEIHACSGATAMFSLQHPDCHAYWGIDYMKMRKTAAGMGVAMGWHPIRDFDVADMRRRLPGAVSGLAALRQAGHTTYVHCTAGLGRAPLTVLGYLALVERVDPDDAIQWILKGRPGACPAWEAFHGAKADLVELHREEIERRAYDRFDQDGHCDACANWLEAEAEVLKGVLTQTPLADARVA